MDALQIYFLQSSKQGNAVSLWQKRCEIFKSSLEKLGCSVNVIPVDKAISISSSGNVNRVGHFFLFDDIGFSELTKLGESWQGPLLVSLSEAMEHHRVAVSALSNVSWVITESGLPKENDFPWISFPSHDFQKLKASLVYVNANGTENKFFKDALLDHDWKLHHIKPDGTLNELLETAFSAKALLFEDLDAGNDFIFLECLFNSQKIIINEKIKIPSRYEGLVLRANFSNTDDLREKIGEALNDYELNSASKQTVPMIEGAQKIYDLYKSLE